MKMRNENCGQQRFSANIFYNLKYLIMKKYFFSLYLLICSAILTAQSNETFELKSKYEAPETKEDFQMELFQGIQKIQFSMNSNPALNGKDYKIVIKEYQDGELHFEKIVLDTKEERLPKIDSTFKFTLFAQNLLNYQKIAFFFPRFMNKKIYRHMTFLRMVILVYGKLM